MGLANRAVGSHDMNEHSSRSHSIVTVLCRGRSKIDGATTFGKEVRKLAFTQAFYVYILLLLCACACSFPF
jgi:hypothetical protein